MHYEGIPRMCRQKFHSLPHNLMIETIQVDFHILKRQYTENQASLMPFKCALDC